MNFSERLREIRQHQGLSQEQLAEKIGVSRQAITKWETGKGLPDIENMVIISEIFKTTLDELITGTIEMVRKHVSETAYDIDAEKHLDLKIGSARSIVLSSGSDEKLHISLQSDTIERLGEVFKIKLDPNKNRLDVDCVKKEKLSRFEAEDALDVVISLPQKFTGHVEVEASVKRLELSGLHIDRLEYDGNAAEVIVKNSGGSFEFTSKSDYEITADKVSGRIDVNQWKARTLVHVPEDCLPLVRNKGRGCDVYFMKDGAILESAPEHKTDDEISASGMFSELVVDLK